MCDGCSTSESDDVKIVVQLVISKILTEKLSNTSN